MAKQILPTNFKDDILSASMNGKRRYIFTQNSDGTWSLEDVTTYEQVGDVLGAARLNAICKAVNESVDQARIIESVDDLKALTESGYVVGGKAGAQIISNLKGFTPIVDSTGRITGYKTEAGADTVFPFSGGKYQIVLTATLAGYKYDTQSGGYTGISSQKNITITMIYENGKCTLKNQNEEFETDIVWYDSPRSAGLFNIRIASVTKLDN